MLSIETPVTIVATTYFPSSLGGNIRLNTAVATFRSWETCLKHYGPIFLHQADDGSSFPAPYPIFKKFNDTSVTFSTQDRHGVGASLNAGFKKAFERSPIVMYLVDDWSLLWDFSIAPWVKLLMEREDIGMVRLGPPHPGTSGKVEALTDDWQGWGLRLDRTGFAFGHRPALYHKRMIDFYGWFAEDVDAMVCERKYNAKFCQDAAGPDIVLALPHPFYHNESVEQGFIVPGEENG